MASEALDRAARAQGFKNYDQFVAWNQRTRQVVLQQPQAAPAPSNWLQNLLGQIPWHPVNTLGYTDRQMKKAMKK